MQYTIVTAQGVGERLDQSQPRMCELVATQLPPGFTEVPVLGPTVGPVGVNPGPSLDASVERAKNAVLEAVDRTPNPAVLCGYSGGAMAVHRAAAEIAAGQHPQLDVRAAGLIADPIMPRGITPSGYGVAGDEPLHGIPTHWLWEDRDPICCAGDPSPLHTLADQLTAMSFGAPDVWAEDLIDRLRSGRWQPSAIDWRHPLATFRRYGRAIDQMGYYIVGGHWTAYRHRGPELATWIHRQVRP